MAHATIPRNSSNFCNDTTSHTKPAALTIPDLMDLLREWWSCQEIDEQSWKRRETMDLRSV